MPPRMETLKFLVYADLDGIVRQLPHDVEEQPRRKMASPVSRISASTPTVIPVSRLYPESITFTPARI